MKVAYALDLKKEMILYYLCLQTRMESTGRRILVERGDFVGVKGALDVKVKDNKNGIGAL